MRAVRGALAYHGGLSAEDQVARHYEASGRAIAARRWRGRAGEIDLIAREAGAVVFIEVKKSRDFAQAAAALSRRQMDRICSAASEFISGEPDGQNTSIRFDLALVDQSGRIEVIGNAFAEA